MAMRVLTVFSYTMEGEELEVTLQPSNISMVTSRTALVLRAGKALRAVNIKFVDEGGAELFISGADLKILQEAVGFYGLDEDFEV